jgi:hypothetical protein
VRAHHAFALTPCFFNEVCYQLERVAGFSLTLSILS